MKRYNESAMIEADILQDIKDKGGCDKGIVYMHEVLKFKEPIDGEHTCLVFETLGKSLYDFIKNNNYKGMQSYPFRWTLEFSNSVSSTQLNNSLTFVIRICFGSNTIFR